MNSAGDLPKEGLPHSDIRGSTIARISPRLFAACHVLHRLLAPRHPPNALVSLTIIHQYARTQYQTAQQTYQCRTASTTLTITNYTSIPRFTCQRSPARARSIGPGATCGGFGSTRPSRPGGRGTPTVWQPPVAAVPRLAVAHTRRQSASSPSGGFFLRLCCRKNGGKRIRTDDPLLAKQVLYQLSYAPVAYPQQDRHAGGPKGPDGSTTPSVAVRRLAATATTGFISLRRIFAVPKAQQKWAREDLNLRPHAYQACALTN